MVNSIGSEPMLVLTVSGAAAAEVSGVDDPGAEQAASAAAASTAIATEPARPTNPPTLRG